MLLTLILTHQGRTIKSFAEDHCGVSEKFFHAWLNDERVSARVKALVKNHIAAHIQEFGLAVANEIPRHAKAA